MNGKTVQRSWQGWAIAKPLKRLRAARRVYTALKRGVNERVVYVSYDNSTNLNRGKGRGSWVEGWGHVSG
jgi:hypothetical protein